MTRGERGRRWVAIFFFAFVAALAAEALRSGLAADRLLRLPRDRVSRDAEAKASVSVPGVEDVTLRTSDGLTLRGWFAPGVRRALVILVHGGGRNRTQLWPDARVLAKHGYGVLVYDSRACGESDGDRMTWGDREQQDLRAALDYASARADVDPSKIALLGLSVGGSTVAMTASRDPRPRAVVLYATWPTLADEIRDKFGKYGPLSEAPARFAMDLAHVDVGNVRPIEAVRALGDRPVLLITGQLDRDTPERLMRQLFDAVPGPKELWVVPGAGHGGYLDVSPAEFEAKLTSFLDAALFPRAEEDR
jgi:pimeloyl-ACP methyl ester carboxylesterase